jgi:hypothetical protein
MQSFTQTWQQQRQNRQQEVLQRRQTVSQALATTRQNRQKTTAQIRQTLNQFHTQLAHADQTRRRESERQSASLQEFHFRLAQETACFLSESRDRRQVEAIEVARELTAFMQVLKQQTADFLEVTAAERSVRAYQVTQDLRDFHQLLTANVSLLRQTFQVQSTLLTHETQQFLAGCQQQRQQMHLETVSTLAAFMDYLRSTIQSHLVALKNLRQDQAARIQQNLAHRRQQRVESVQNLGDRAARFRRELPASEFSCHLTALNPAPPLVALLPVVPSAIPYATDIYSYLQRVQGARLGEIESALELNRIQTVDALRSLMEQGLVVQRDRLYWVSDLGV